jgi:hypothetical protein
MADAGGQVRYFFALNMFQSARVISRMMSSIVEAMRDLSTVRYQFLLKGQTMVNEILTELKPVELMTRQELRSHCEDM